MERREELRANLEATYTKIRELADAAGRKAPELLPVTKFHPASDIAILRELGISDVAENREQEAREKAAELPDIKFHMIGQVQTKKANHVARWASSVHSVDSEKLARALDRGVELAIERGQRAENLPIYIQISADGDTSRGGVAQENLDNLVEIVGQLKFLELQGLMVVPPLESDPQEVFSRVRGLCDDLGETMKLSAGMSADLTEAIACGSDIVRVGTGILGTRPVI